MRTNKHISNIAYHREPVFAAFANTLRKADRIGPCLWVAHKAEGNEKKDHLHILLVGGVKTYNTDGLSALFGWDEIDGKMASVTPLWKPTKNLSDWLLYGVHDERYLLTKGEDRQHSYSWADIHVTSGDEDLLETLIVEAKDFRDHLGDKIVDRLRMLRRKGWGIERAIATGLVPLPLVSQAIRAWGCIAEDVWAEQHPYALGSRETQP